MCSCVIVLAGLVYKVLVAFSGHSCPVIKNFISDSDFNFGMFPIGDPIFLIMPKFLLTQMNVICLI